MKDSIGVFLDDFYEFFTLSLLVGDLVGVHLRLILHGVFLLDLLLWLVGLLAFDLTGDDLASAPFSNPHFRRGNGKVRRS